MYLYVHGNVATYTDRLERHLLKYILTCVVKYKSLRDTIVPKSQTVTLHLTGSMPLRRRTFRY